MPRIYLLLISTFYLFLSDSYGQIKIRKVIYFDVNSNELKSADQAWLDSLSAKAVKSEKYTIDIKAYCDNSGSEEYNQKLSDHRAKAVLDRLLKNQLHKEFITAKGFGRLSPLNDNSTAILQQQNRRAEVSFFLTEKKQAPEITELPKEPVPITIAAAPVSENFDSISTGKKIVLKGLNFYGGSATPLPSSQQALKELLKVMEDNPLLEIEIIGHVCCYNDHGISLERAKTVFNYLKQHHIKESRMTYKGVSNSEPIASEDTPEGQAANRRVEILVKKF